MKTYLVPAALLGVIAAPAVAADGPYIGVEGGLTFPRSTDLDVILNNVTAGTSATYDNGYSLKSKTGWDLDALAGYKLGLIRLEVQGGYQRAPVKSIGVDSTLLSDVGTATGTTVSSSDFGLGSKMGVEYLTANALLDSDIGGGFGAYAGGGVGRAWASFSGDKDSTTALTAIAGVRYALTSNLDAGVKYQYLHTGKLDFSDAFAVNGTDYASSARGNYNSHNVLASLVYNFNGRASAPAEPAAMPVAPPPPPAAPATQTCPDGSVIEATATCPAAPPPPPPPAPTQRGERG
jgi:opacity protein-like surface antigen